MHIPQLGTLQKNLIPIYAMRSMSTLSTVERLGVRRMSLQSHLAQVISIFVSYAEEDTEFFHGLERQLSSLSREGLIQCSNRYRLSPGTEWREKAKEELEVADIILLLVSSFFVASDYCYQEEAMLAMALHNRKKTPVIPIIVRPVEWEQADSPEILLSSFVDLSAVLDLPEKNEENQPSIVKAVKRWLQQNTHWLLVVDNLEDIDLLRDMVPSPHSGHILVTTRSRRTGHIAHRVDLEPMQISDDALFLLRRAKRT